VGRVYRDVDGIVLVHSGRDSIQHGQYKQVIPVWITFADQCTSETTRGCCPTILKLEFPTISSPKASFEALRWKLTTC
jgi:hypothetical protein